MGEEVYVALYGYNYDFPIAVIDSVASLDVLADINPDKTNQLYYTKPISKEEALKIMSDIEKRVLAFEEKLKS